MIAIKCNKQLKGFGSWNPNRNEVDESFEGACGRKMQTTKKEINRQVGI